jgi:serine/threonine-protein kinase RsbW
MKQVQDPQTTSLFWEIPSRLDQVEALCLEIRAALDGNKLKWAAFTIELVVRECLNNAVLHGNYNDASKRVALNLCWTSSWVCLQVADEGEGFDWKKALRRPPPNLENPSGRGLYIVTCYADPVLFNRKGNQITVWLRKQVQRKRK